MISTPTQAINKNILHIAIPSIVSNITVPLLGLIDVAIVGHLGSPAYIGAIALGGTLFNVIYWIFAFLRMGTTGMTSQAYGRKEWEEVIQLLVRATSIGLAIALALLVLQIPICQAAMNLMQPPTAEVEQITTTYFYICIWGAPAMLSLYALSGWFIGMHNSRIPMYIAFVQNGVNIAASLCLVYLFDLKVVGVALGTLIAQYAGVLVAIILFFRHYSHLRQHITYLGLWSRRAMGEFFRVNRDIFFRTLCMVAVTLFFTSAGATQGEIILAANTLLMQLFILFSYFMDGFANAGEALAGSAYGAKNQALLGLIIRRLFIWFGGLALLFTLLYWVGGIPFLHLLTNEADVIQVASRYYYWAVAIPFVGMTAFLWDGIFIGLTATRQMLISMAVAAITFLGVYWSSFSLWGNDALWLSFLLYLLIRGWVQTWLAHRMNLLKRS
ncbi:MAG: MATE family efflux transporter [Phocaeicola sp.]